MAAPSRVQAGTAAEDAASNTSLAVPYPASVTSGNKLFLHVGKYNADVTLTVDTPSGWNVWFSDRWTITTENDHVQYVFWRDADGTETGNVTVTSTGGSGGGNIVAQIYEYQDVAAGASFSENSHGSPTAGPTTGNPMNMPAVTTSAADRLAMAFGYVTDDATVSSATGESGGDWAVVDNATGIGGSDSAIFVQTATIAAAGTISGGTASHNRQSLDVYFIRGIAIFGGAVAPSGAAAGSLQVLVAAASGELGFSGAAVAAVQNLAASAAGTHAAFAGAAAGALQNLGAAAAGELVFAGSASAVLQNLAAVAAGELGFSGAAATTLEELVAAAAGRAEAQGTAAAALQVLVAAAAGDFTTNTPTGTAAAALQNLLAAATGLESFDGTAVGALQHLVASATGRAEAQGAAAVALQVLAASAAGQLVYGGSAAAVLQILEAAASGAFAEGIEGSAAAALQHLIAAASGQGEAQAAAAAELQPLIAAAVGSFSTGEVPDILPIWRRLTLDTRMGM